MLRRFASGFTQVGLSPRKWNFSRRKKRKPSKKDIPTECVGLGFRMTVGVVSFHISRAPKPLLVATGCPGSNKKYQSGSSKLEWENKLPSHILMLHSTCQVGSVMLLFVWQAQIVHCSSQMCPVTCKLQNSKREAHAQLAHV